MAHGPTKLDSALEACDFAVSFHKSERGFDEDEWLAWSDSNRPPLPYQGNALTK